MHAAWRCATKRSIEKLFSLEPDLGVIQKYRSKRNPIDDGDYHVFRLSNVDAKRTEDFGP
jgi:hypothetical protein